MCNAFSCIVTKEGKVFWEAGKDSHEDLIQKHNLSDNETESHKLEFARIEIIPDNTEKYSYLYPELEWKFKVDEQNKPNWLKNSHEQKCWTAFKEWKTQTYNFNYLEARNPINPFKIEPPTKINEEHIKLLQQWTSVRDSVRASVWDSVMVSIGASVRESIWASVWASVMVSIGDSIRASVRDSVRAYVGSLFPKAHELNKDGKYIFQSAVDLWRQGIVPSFDGTTWRLHTKNGIVYEVSKNNMENEKL